MAHSRSSAGPGQRPRRGQGELEALVRAHGFERTQVEPLMMAALWVEDEGPGLPVAPGTDLFAPLHADHPLRAVGSGGPEVHELVAGS